ncbi:MAG: ArsS family sensor histidine kinase [Campylobacter sp.]|nr:ArsS family sensor histidine kinase [Campylobacter sp.]
MKFSSIFYSITFIFMLGSSGIFLAYLWLKEYDKQNYTRELNTKYSVVSRVTLLKYSGIISDNEYEAQIKGFEMPQILDDALIKKVIDNAQIIEEQEQEIGKSAILTFNNNNYLRLISNNDDIIVLYDDKFQAYRYDVITLIFSLVFLVLLAVYIFIIRKLKPLRRLKREIKKFAGGDLEIDNVATGADEISQVADAFYDAVRQIKLLNHNRALFLRNIMHELKTPITKGRITAEMLPQNKYQERLISVFARLESLINEFALIERASSKLQIVEKSRIPLKTTITKALDIAMAESGAVEIKENDDIIIKADEKLISVAFKNIIDNGIKYASDHKVLVEINSSDICFITSGEPLKNELSYYIQPFTKDGNAKNSFGLGLYIVENILKAHNFMLEYEHENGKNIFKVNFKLQENK